MGIIGAAAKGIMGFFGGGTAQKVAGIADEYIHTSQERTDTDQQDLASARAMPFVSHGSPFDVLVDAVIRLIRPGITVWLIGGFIGWWMFPDLDTIDPFYQNLVWLVFSFHFGGRAIMKDIPNFLKLLRKMK